jgi:hypothetical protein
MRSKLDPAVLGVALAILAALPAPAHAIPQAERSALLGLYSATGGSGWVERTGWTGKPGTECSWFGVVCDGTGATVTDLFLPDNNLSGALPASLANLSNLRSLELDGNAVTGSIPRDLGRLANLRSLRLSFNQLSGAIPRELGNLRNLEVLGLGFNRLSGAIPTDLGKLTRLQILDLSRNEMTGSLPAQLGQLTDLVYLDLSANRLSGGIPSELGNLEGLLSLYLGGNQLSGSIPRQLGNLAVLQQLDLGGNQLSGRIPADLGNLLDLLFLDLHQNQLTGTIPPELGGAASLLGLILSDNRLGGTIPSDLGNLFSLTTLWLDGNRLTGPVPFALVGLPDLTDGGGLDLRDNALSPNIDSFLLSYLDSKQLGGNWIATQAPFAPLDAGASLADLEDERAGGLIVWTVEVGAGAPPLSFSTDDAGTGNVDLYVRFGVPPTTAQFDVSSKSPGNQESVTIQTPKAGTYYVGLHASTPYMGVTLRAGGSVCFPSGTALCLSGGRFKVEVDWKTRGGETGKGKAVALTPDTGYFWFFNEANVEMVIKVLDACALNQKFWVFAGGLTDVQVDITVTDTRAETSKTYRNPQQTAFQPIQDTGAFATCDEELTAEASAVEIEAAAQEAWEDVKADCAAGPNNLCLSGGRFRVEATWTTRDGGTGQGKAVPLTGDTGYFWFFNESNVEMVIKVLDACGLNQKFWVFAGGLTDVQVQIRVTDTVTDMTKTYDNPQGTAFRPVQDTGAFGTCP